MDSSSWATGGGFSCYRARPVCGVCSGDSIVRVCLMICWRHDDMIFVCRFSGKPSTGESRVLGEPRTSKS